MDILNGNYDKHIDIALISKAKLFAYIFSLYAFMGYSKNWSFV
ncbi:hypothetical protein [Campylobacter portucalensis]|nr:hypothetical protein [Campylobacter portucalensis]